MNEQQETRVQIDLQNIASITGVSVDVIRSHQRTMNIVDARHLAYWWLRHRHHLTYPVIGRMLNRDHSTILDACEGFESRCSRRGRLARWRRRLNGDSTRFSLDRDWILLDAA